MKAVYEENIKDKKGKVQKNKRRPTKVAVYEESKERKEECRN
jgi:hypothetical protein